MSGFGIESGIEGGFEGGIVGIVLDYGHGVRVHLTGCTAEHLSARPADTPPAADACRAWSTSPEKLDRMLYGR